MEQDQSKRKVHHQVYKVAAFLGVGSVLLAACGALAMYYATNKSIERANQRTADLLARLGAAEERANRMDFEMSKASTLVARLQLVDEAQLTRVLQLASSDEAVKLLNSTIQRRELDDLWERVGTIYAQAHWGSKTEFYKKPGLWRDALAVSWETDDLLRKRSEAGDKNTNRLRSDAACMHALSMELYSSRRSEIDSFESTEKRNQTINDAYQRLYPGRTAPGSTTMPTE